MPNTPNKRHTSPFQYEKAIYTATTEDHRVLAWRLHYMNLAEAKERCCDQCGATTMLYGTTALNTDEDHTAICHSCIAQADQDLGNVITQTMQRK